MGQYHGSHQVGSEGGYQAAERTQKASANWDSCEKGWSGRMKASFETFLWAIVLGMGFHIGWGLISLIIALAAKAVGQPAFLN